MLYKPCVSARRRKHVAAYYAVVSATAYASAANSVSRQNLIAIYYRIFAVIVQTDTFTAPLAYNVIRRYNRVQAVVYEPIRVSAFFQQTPIVRAVGFYVVADKPSKSSVRIYADSFVAFILASVHYIHVRVLYCNAVCQIVIYAVYRTCSVLTVIGITLRADRRIAYYEVVRARVHVRIEITVVIYAHHVYLTVRNHF